MECPDRSDRVRTQHCSLNFISTYFLAKSVLHLSTLLLIILISIKHTLLTSIKSFFNLTPTSHSNSLFSFFFPEKLIRRTDEIISFVSLFLISSSINSNLVSVLIEPIMEGRVILQLDWESSMLFSRNSQIFQLNMKNILF